jgi:hypothetical protein
MSGDLLANSARCRAVRSTSRLPPRPLDTSGDTRRAPATSFRGKFPLGGKKTVEERPDYFRRAFMFRQSGGDI